MSATDWDEGFGDFIAEAERFRNFPAATRRYIVRALDFGLTRGDPHRRWTRDFGDLPILLATGGMYHCLPFVRRFLADGGKLERGTTELASLQRVADLELQWEEMADFEAFGFLYERLFGAEVRPWITSLFCGAATSPLVDREYALTALRSLTLDAGPEWNRDRPVPSFMPVSDDE